VDKPQATPNILAKHVIEKIATVN